MLAITKETSNALPTLPREDWFTEYQPEPSDEDAWETLPPDEGDEEWQW
jgi:hypothetical protein